ncbi:MAG: ABC transporter permease subunit [Tenericutes bacterium]|nr:ABC transporter permease subunit [Mycoplasmatota bacterium]
MKVVMKMNKRNIFNLVKFNLKINKSNVLGWFISIFSIMLIYMILFPTIKDIGMAKMELIPEEMLKFFNLNSLNDMNNYVSYFGMIFNIVLIAISIFAATFSAKLICKEENTKSIEFLNALHISRNEIYISKLITAFISITLVLLGAISATIFSGFIVGGKTFILNDVLIIIKVTSFTAYMFMALSFLISGITSKINVSSISSIIVLFCYMIGFLGTLIEKKWLTYFSPFEILKPNNALAMSNSTILILSIYFVLTFVFIFVGLKFYKKRDFYI